MKTEQAPSTPKCTPEWQKQAEGLVGKHFTGIVITDRISPSQAITGFIYSRLGVVNVPSNFLVPTIFVRELNQIAEVNKSRGLPLFNPNVNNPSTMKHLVDISSLDPNEKRKLKRLADFTTVYRALPDEKWYEARPNIKNWKDFCGLDLHDLMLFIIKVHGDSPGEAYEKLQHLLARTLTSGEYKGNLGPASLTVPVLKSQPGDTDRIEYTDISFDRKNILYLKNLKTIVSIGGSPHSGKSTFSASLATRMHQLVGDCIEDGILEEDELKIGFCNLDLADTTSENILKGTKRSGKKKKWDINLLKKASDKLADVRFENNVTIADLPGGTPDWITFTLARACRFLILVDKSEGRDLDSWRNFVTNPPKTEISYWQRTPVVPTHLIHIYSKLANGQYSNGLREFTSLSRGGKKNYFVARAVGLDKTLKPEDPIIDLAAHILLFDYLPNTITRQLDYQSQLHLAQTGQRT